MVVAMAASPVLRSVLTRRCRSTGGAITLIMAIGLVAGLVTGLVVGLGLVDGLTGGDKETLSMGRAS